MRGYRMFRYERLISRKIYFFPLKSAIIQFRITKRHNCD